MNKQKGLAPILIVFLIALAVGGYLLYQKQTKPASQPLTQSSSAPIASSSVDTSNWKTYTNKGLINYSLDYPPTWRVNPHQTSDKNLLDEGVTFFPPDNSPEKKKYNLITIECSKHQKDLNNFTHKPVETTPKNEGNYQVVYSTEYSFDQGKGEQYIWSNEDFSGELTTILYEKTRNSSCQLFTWIKYPEGDFKSAIDSMDVYNKILSTFKFLQ